MCATNNRQLSCAASILFPLARLLAIIATVVGEEGHTPVATCQACCQLTLIHHHHIGKSGPGPEAQELLEAAERLPTICVE